MKYMNTMRQHMSLNKQINKMAMVLCAAILIPVMSSCLNDLSKGEEPQDNVTFDTRALPVEIMKHATLYVFDENNLYLGKQYNVTKTGDVMSTSMAVGKYQLGLISCESEDITANSQFKVPTPYAGNMQISPMWVTGTYTNSDSKTLLSQTPELLYVPIRDVVILHNQTTPVDTRLFRNVAQVQFVLQDHDGFDTMFEAQPNKNAFIDLLNVPTTLTWEGKYGRSGGEIIVAKDGSSNLIPMRENLIFNYNKENKFVADTVRFIIPAGTESNSHKLKFQISMPIAGQPFYGKSDTPIEIIHTPKPNTIIRVNILKFRGEPDTNLDIKVTVKDWLGPLKQTNTIN